MNLIEYTALTRKVAPLNPFVLQFFDDLENNDHDYETLIEASDNRHVFMRVREYAAKIASNGPGDLSAEAQQLFDAVDARILELVSGDE